MTLRAITLRATRARRAGFTLVELLVVMALVVLIMSILSQAFVEGLKTVRNVKGIGDMQESLRSAVVPLRNDLLQRHFDGTQKLGASFRNYTRPSSGFFRIEQATAHSLGLEGNDGDGLPSYLIAGDLLHMSVVVVGDRRSDYFSVGYAPPSTSPDPSDWLRQEGPVDYRWVTGSTQPPFMNSQKAEVMWFLRPMNDPSGVQLKAGPSNTPLFSLHRRQRLLVNDNNAQLNTGTSRIPSTAIASFPEIACKVDLLADPNMPPIPLYFPNLTDLATPSLRSMMNAAGTYSAPDPFPGTTRGQDRVISDVISFEIKVLPQGEYEFKDIRTIQARYPKSFPGSPNGIYDTATWPVNDPTPTSNTNKEDVRVTIRAIQIVIRVWDAKTEQTRQVTLIQDM